MARAAGEEPADRSVQDDPAADPMAVAREIALRQLTVRARSRAELAQALRKRNVPDDIARQVLDRFTDVGLIDDAAFAGQWVASGGRRQRSRAALRHELLGKGLASEVVAQAISEVSDDDEYAAALALARKRAAASRDLPGPTKYRRVLGALARRGFPSGLAHRAAREALGEEAAGDGIGDAI